MMLIRKNTLFCAVLGIAFAATVWGDEADGDVTFLLDNGCSITRRPVNSTAPPIPWYGMPLPHLNCSGAGLTRLDVEAVVNDTKSISLSYNDMIEFHVDDLKEFPGVEKLELKVNKLTRVVASQDTPEAMMKSLRYISLTHNKLTAVPNAALKSFPELKFLILFSNAITKFRNDDFRYNKKLEFLYLGPNPVETFEDDFLSKMNLTGLGLRSCGLKSLPVHIATMTRLVYLDLSVNKLTSLSPNSFRDCRQLRWLEIASNQIHTVDAFAFKGAFALKMIDLSDNLITVIPNNTFSDISKERVEIDLYENPLVCDCSNAWLKGWYDELVEHDMSTELRFKCVQPLRNHGKKSYQLQLSDFTCKDDDQQWQDCNAPSPPVTSSPLTVTSTTTPVVDNPAACPEGCTCFDEMGKQYSPATDTTDSKPGLRQIRGFRYKMFAQLSVSCIGTGLTRIPVEDMRSDVKMIIFSDNNISTLDLVQFKKFKDLKILNLKRNGIKKIKAAPTMVLEQVTLLNLRFNNITAVSSLHFKSFPNLEIITLYHNQIKYFPDKLFSNNRKLNRVYLGPNPIKTFNFHFLKDLDLFSLSLRKLSLNSVPAEISTLKNLTFLDMSDNFITSVPNGTFSTTSALFRLRMENNKIESIGVNAFNGATLLQWLYLSENKIKTLPAGVFSNISQERLKVELWSNPMVCDCNLRWFKTWIEETEERDPTTDVRFICTSPSRVHNKKSDELTPEDFVCEDSDKGDDGTNAISCQVCKVPAGSIALTALLTFLATAICCCVAWRCTFKRRYGELIQYAKQRDNYGQMDDM